jgi:hypothetical protein
VKIWTNLRKSSETALFCNPFAIHLQFIFNPLKSSKAIAAAHDDLTAKFLGHGRMFWCIEAGLSSFMRRVAPIWNLQPDDRTRIDPKFFDCRAY